LCVLKSFSGSGVLVEVERLVCGDEVTGVDEEEDQVGQERDASWLACSVRQ
jgi:hypothetical protein